MAHFVSALVLCNNPGASFQCGHGEFKSIPCLVSQGLYVESSASPWAPPTIMLVGMVSVKTTLNY